MQPKGSYKRRIAWWAWLLYFVSMVLACLAFFIYYSADGIGFYKFEDSKSSQALKILFIGNSLTYVNDLPAVFASLIKQESPKQELKIYSVCYPNYYLSEHVTNPQTLAAISSAPWDYVIVQQHSICLLDPSPSQKDFEKILQLIRRKLSQTKICIFQIWDNQEIFHVDSEKRRTQDFLVTYEEIANKLNCHLIPIGECWLAFSEYSKTTPRLCLYGGDGHHPSPVGTYLTACAIYADLFNKLPEKLPTDIWRFSWGFCPRSLVHLSNDDARLLSNTAKFVVLNKEFKYLLLNTSFYYKHGEDYSKLKQYQKAINEYSKAIELDPKFDSAFTSRAEAYGSLGQYQKVVEDHSRAIELQGSDSWRLQRSYNSRANAYNHLRQYQKAINDCNSALTLRPADTATTEMFDLYGTRGEAYYQLHQYAKAIDDSSKAIKILSRDALPYLNRAKSYDKLGKHELVVKDYESAKKWLPHVH